VTSLDGNAISVLKYNAWMLAQHLKSGQTRSNSWSDSLELEHRIEVNRSLLGDHNRVLYDNFKKAYAEILYSFGLLSQRAQVLKYLSVPPPAFSGVEFFSECKICKKTARGPSCLQCKSYIMLCSLCRLPVKGSANACLTCGHGGHTAHLMQWFSKYDVCPAGCGCKCVEAAHLT